MGVPVIDMKNIDGGDREVIMAEIAKACESTGFFQVKNTTDHIFSCAKLTNYRENRVEVISFCVCSF